MALYLFVATPIQFWHHHNNTKSRATVAVEKQLTNGISSATDNVQEGDCQICSHQFSSYNEVGNLHFAIPLFQAIAMAGFYTTPILPIAVSNFSNRGPPATS
jgi:hypothetical protein